MLVSTTLQRFPQRVFRKDRSSWTRLASLASICLVLCAACGPAIDPDSAQVAAIKRDGHEEDSFYQDDDQNLLSFSSELKRFATEEFEVGLSLGGTLLGGRVRAKVALRLTDASALSLRKIPASDDSQIFLADDGRLDVRVGEEFMARCEYTSSVSFTRSSDFQITMAGASIETDKGTTRLYESAARGTKFPVEGHDTLTSLQNACENRFHPEVSERLHADLLNALKSQARVQIHGDPRVEAMRRLLLRTPAHLNDGSYTWKLAPPQITETAQELIVEGHLVRDRFLGDQSFAYQFTFSTGTDLIIESAAISPPDRGDVAFAALRMATFVARNTAEWFWRSKQGSEMVIETDMLDVKKNH